MDKAETNAAITRITIDRNVRARAMLKRIIRDFSSANITRAGSLSPVRAKNGLAVLRSVEISNKAPARRRKVAAVTGACGQP